MRVSYKPMVAVICMRVSYKPMVAVIQAYGIMISLLWLHSLIEYSQHKYIINPITIVTPINLDGDPSVVEHLLLFGRELQTLFGQLDKSTPNMSRLQVLLQDSFSLLAYTDPVDSPVGYLLCQSQREPVASLLNSAILS